MHGRTNRRVWRVAAVAGAATLCALAVATGLGMGVVASPAASPIYVRTDGDDVNCNGTADTAYPGGGPGLNCAVATIQKGIALVTPGGTVIVAAGVYYEDPDINKGLTLLGAGAGSTIIDAGGSSRGLNLITTAGVTISNVTVRNGGGYTGAGIFAGNGGALTLTGSIISNNTACGGCSGGGLYLGSSATAVVSGCSFIDNATGVAASGGAIHSWGSTLTVVNSTFTGNEANGRGGAIHSGGSGSSLTVIESTFSGNTVIGVNASGGAIWSDTGTLIISDTTVVSNSSSYNGGGVTVNSGTGLIRGSLIAGNWVTGTASCYGGGIHTYQGTLVVEDSVLRDNWVSGGSSLGGGIFSDHCTTLNRVTVSGNSSDYQAGGIHSQGLLTMTNVTLSGNSAASAAGGFDLADPAVLVNCTIAGNTLSSASPGAGGGIQVFSTLRMTNTLLADNDGANCGIFGGGSVSSGGHNLEDGDSCGLGAAGDITGTDPLLGSLGTYGRPMVGSTVSQEPMRLRFLGRGSPAIDAGSGCPAVDQRGAARPVDGDGDATATCDIGAYEFDLLNGIFLPLVLRNL